MKDYGYRTFEEWLDERLIDPEHAAGFLNAVLEEGDPDLLLQALADVARVHGMSKFAKKASLSRMGLYKSLSRNGNPGLHTFLNILKASGLKLSFAAA